MTNYRDEGDSRAKYTALQRYLIVNIEKPTGTFKLEPFSHDVDTFCVSARRHLLPLFLSFESVKTAPITLITGVSPQRPVRYFFEISFFFSSLFRPHPSYLSVSYSFRPGQVSIPIFSLDFLSSQCQFQISPAMFATLSASFSLC